MREWIIEYDVVERSRFQYRTRAETEDQAMANFRDDAEAAGYNESGIWQYTEDVTPVLDSIKIKEVS